ncbi:MAG: DUF4230 domain-containing protein [Eggerthellaceae bacterium]|nr:DUF4230 domain-containing protein [Eggerthellaceae bacterium]
MANETAKDKKKRGGCFGRVVLLAIGVILGFFGASFALDVDSPPTETKVIEEQVTVDITVLQEGIAKASELTTAKQSYTLAKKVEKTDKLFGKINLPITTSSFVLVYSGVVHAGVDLKDAVISLDDTTKTVVVALPAAKILVNAADADTYKVLDEENNILNPIKVEDVTDYLRESQHAAEKAAAESKVLAEAQANAEEVVRAMLETALPEGYSIMFEGDGEAWPSF